MHNTEFLRYFNPAPPIRQLARQEAPPDSRAHSLAHVLPDALPDAWGNPSVFGTLLNFLYRIARDVVRTGERITIEAHSLPTGTHIAFLLPPSPAVQHIFQRTPASDRKRTPPAVQAMSPALAAFMLAEKIAARNAMKIWLDLEPMQLRLNLYLHDYPRMAPVERERPLVLVIEDVPAIGKLLEYYLAHAGFQTLHALNGESGIEIACEKKPDLITLDVWMPSMDGMAVLNILKSSEETRNIPVVLITVLPNRLVGYERGASDYLQKPVLREDVIECAHRLTRPTPPMRPEAPEKPRSVLIIQSAGGAESRLAALAPEASTYTFDFSDPALVSSAGAINPPPDLMLLDFSSETENCLAVARRLRLLDHLDASSLIAVVPPSALRAVQAEAAGYIDGIVPPDVADIGQCAEAVLHGPVAA